MKVGKKLKKRNILGAAIMTGLILAAMPMGVAHSLEGLREEAEGAYYYDNAGYAIYDGLDKRREAAHNLLTVAQKYTEAHPELGPYVEELEYRVQASENAYDDTFYWAGATNAEMGAAAEALAAELEKITLDEKDRKYPAQMIAQMQSEQDKIERSSYNDAAREFNSRLQVFPVNILRNFTGVKELVPFDEHGVVDTAYVVEDSAGEALEQAQQVQVPEEDMAEAFAEQVEDQVEAWADNIEETVEGALERP